MANKPLVDKAAFVVIYGLKGLASASASVLALVFGVDMGVGVGVGVGVSAGVGVGVWRRRGRWRLRGTPSLRALWWPIDSSIAASSRHRA